VQKSFFRFFDADETSADTLGRKTLPVPTMLTQILTGNTPIFKSAEIDSVDNGQTALTRMNAVFAEMFNACILFFSVG
jgi:hypothetical protein